MPKHPSDILAPHHPSSSTPVGTPPAQDVLHRCWYFLQGEAEPAGNADWGAAGPGVSAINLAPGNVSSPLEKTNFNFSMLEAGNGATWVLCTSQLETTKI